MFTTKANKIKVLHVTASLRMGGAENLILGLLKHANRAQVFPHLFAFGKLEENLLWEDFLKLKLPYHQLQVASLYTPKVLVSLMRYTREHQIDVIHTHLCDGDIIGRMAGWLLGIPVVSTLQNTPSDFLSYRADRRILAKSTARLLAPYGVAVSQLVKEQFHSEWGLPLNRLTTITNAIDIDRFLTTQKHHSGSHPDRPFVIINVARLTKQKAQHTLLKAAAILKESNQSFEVWFVGDGELKDSLIQKSQELGLTERIKFLGVRRDIPELLEQADLFTLSSNWEGLPLSAIEAMAAALPVVLTDVGGNSELIVDGENGYLVSPNRPAELANAILKLILDQQLRLNLGQAARESVKHKFHIKTIASQYDTLYKQITKENKLPELVNQGV